jgi:hypothetical protein
MTTPQPRDDPGAAIDQIRQAHTMLGRALAALDDQHGWFTALGYSRVTGIPDTSTEALQRLGQAAAAVALRYGVRRRRASDDRYGMVNSFPRWVWDMAVQEQLTGDRCEEAAYGLHRDH